MKGKIVVIIVALLVTSWLAGGVKFGSAQDDEIDLSRETAQEFVTSHVKYCPEWEKARLGNAMPLTDLQGRLIAYLFPLFDEQGQIVGKVVVGNSLYDYRVLEAGNASLPSPPGPVEVREGWRCLKAPSVNLNEQPI